MANLVADCPSCRRQLRVPDDLLGKLVKCPSCGTTFTAGGAAPTASVRPADPPPAAPPPGPEGPAGRYGGVTDFGDPDVFRRDFVPHRGGVVLAMGILSIVCCGVIFGPIAWVMANNDLPQIRAGRMDPAGEGLTNAGKVCGIIGVIKAALEVVCLGFSGIASFLDQMK
jgi:predicted Zn finger-like uncharacterized protein